MVGENSHFVCLKYGKLLDLGNLTYDSCPDRQ